MTIAKNEVVEIRIDTITPQGYGVGRIDGRVVFVKNALPGELVNAKVVMVKKNYLGAIIENITEKSNDRIEPKCELFGKCGGCTIQDMTYASQLKYKQDNVKECLQHIAGIENPEIKDIIGMGNPWEYRNKTQYPVQRNQEYINIGFYHEKTHRVIDVATCPIQMSAAAKVRTLFKDFLLENKIPIYNELTEEGIVRNLMIRISKKTGRIMIIIVINGRTIPMLDAFIFNAKNKIPEIASVYLNVNKDKTNVILGEKFKLVFGEKKLLDSIGKKDFFLSPGSFFQVNPMQTETLYNKTLELCELTGKEIVLDLFSGIGTIGIFLAENAKEVIGVESYEKAVEDANENAKLNKTENISFRTGKAEDIIKNLQEENIIPDIVVLDPPRKGLEKELIEVLKELSPKRIVYVSCDPATLARDVKIFLEEGEGKAKYELSVVQPIDMFPQTGHVECVIRLQRQNSL